MAKSGVYFVEGQARDWHMNRKVYFGAIAALMIAGCSKGGEPGNGSAAGADSAVSSSQALNACSIVSDAEMSDALGAPVAGKEETNAGHCIYKTASPLVYADVEIDRENADAAWKGVNAGDSLIGAPQDSLTGIGEKAFFGLRDRLYVRKRDAFIAIEAGFDDKVRERAKKIARLVSAKL